MRKLRNYQKSALLYCRKVTHPALFMEMRLGKTLVAVRYIKPKAKKILVVAPYSAFDGWYKELNLEDENNKGIVELTGEKKARRHLLFETFDKNKWFIINREGHLSLPEIAHFKWDAVIVDESHCLKGERTAISKFFIDNFRLVPIRMILTGTPAPEVELNYFNQLQFLNPEIFTENNYYQFKYNNFGIIHHNIMISPKGSRYIAGRLAQYCFFLSRRNVKLGGRKVYEQRFIRMSQKARKIYRTAAKEFILELNGREIDRTIFATTKYIWLRRICGGFVDGRLLFEDKVNELLYLLKTELKNQPVIVICKFIDEVKMVSKIIARRGKLKTGMIYGKVPPKKRREIVKAFQSGKMDCIVAQPETLKLGVDLSVSDTVIFYSSPDGLETRLQIEDRVVNTARNDSSLIIDLIMDKTVEATVYRSLARKEGRQTMMRRIVQEIQRMLKWS